MDSYNQFFEKITGFQPYIYQNEMNDRFQDNSGVILQAPTGAGKTWSAILPFVYCWYQWKKCQQRVESFPRKLIYSLPLRTLANSLYKIVKETIKSKIPELSISVTLQTGEYPNDPLFEGDIIFTTIDQTLSNVLCIPLSLPKKLANINAGAVVSSFLVFDEVHLLDPFKALSTTITLLKLTEGITPFCLMTATLSDSFVRKVSSYLNASTIKVRDEDYENLSFVKKNAEKCIQISNSELSAEAVLHFHKNKTIVICNTVSRCIDLYKEIKNRVDDSVSIVCIHSNFFHKDRKEKESIIVELFGRESNKEAILLSTQVIEVGLDISCDTMHCEISPINSFLQRIGRCARWKGFGDVWVYDIHTDSTNPYLPYNKELTQITLSALEGIGAEKFDHFLAQSLIEQVMSNVEEKVIQEIKYASEKTRNSIIEAWSTGGLEKSRELIRDIESISVVLLPENSRVDSLYKYETISINPHTLKKKLLNKQEEYEDECPQLVFSLEESNYDWEELSILYPISVQNINNHNIVALNSEFVGYNTEYGLDFDQTTGIQSDLMPPKLPKLYTIKMDSYEQHIKWMFDWLEREKSYHFLLNRLNRLYNEGKKLDQLLKYILITHDYGKLDMKWQKITNDYQREKFRKVGKVWTYQVLAHTDYNPNDEEDKKIEETVLKANNLGRKPDHSGIGAYLTLRVLPLLYGWQSNDPNAVSLLKVAITAINRHHSAFAERSPSYCVEPKAIQMITNLLKDIGLNVSNQSELFQFFSQGNSFNLKMYQTQFNITRDVLSYFLLVRLLRLCDQHSFELNPLYRKGEN